MASAAIPITSPVDAFTLICADFAASSALAKELPTTISYVFFAIAHFPPKGFPVTWRAPDFHTPFAGV